MIKYCNLFLPVLFLLLLGLSSTGQTAFDTVAFKKSGRVTIDTSHPGADNARADYLLKNLNASAPVVNGAPVGKYTVIVQYIVDKAGVISDVKALTNHGYGMEEEAMKVLRKGPNPWKPAGQKEVKSEKKYGKQVVSFFVEDTRLNISTASPYTLYSNTDNKISILVYKLKPADMTISLSRGSITKTSDGNYIIIVDEPGKQLTMTIKKKRKKKALWVVNFEVEKAFN